LTHYCNTQINNIITNKVACCIDFIFFRHYTSPLLFYMTNCLHLNPYALHIYYLSILLFDYISNSFHFYLDFLYRIAHLEHFGINKGNKCF
jgi:hypothetical protein